MKRTADADRHFSRAIKTFNRRLARGTDDPSTKYYMAALYALKGETDRVLRYLDDTIQHLPALNRTRARMDPDFDGVRTDPRFTALIDGH